MKKLLLLLFLLSMLTVHAQKYVFEDDYIDYVSRSAQAAKYHYKSRSIYAYKKGRPSREALYAKDEYDRQGRIIRSSIMYPRNPEEVKFYYDDKGRLIKVTDAFKPYKYGGITLIGYNGRDTAAYMLSVYSDLDAQLAGPYDTVFYVYNANGSIHYRNEKHPRSNRSDTTYYHYTTAGEVINTSRKPDDMHDPRILDGKGCYIGNKDDTLPADASQTRFRTSYVCDSLCNALQAKEEMSVNGKWQPFADTYSRYENGRLAEETYYSYSGRLGGLRKKATFRSHETYEYDTHGILKTVTSYNKRNRITEVRKTVYETYDDAR